MDTCTQALNESRSVLQVSHEKHKIKQKETSEQNIYLDMILNDQKR